MVWGRAEPRGVEDLVERLRNNDPNLKSLTLLRGRRFGPEEVVQVCDALDANCVLQEFHASGHLLMPPSATRFAETLAKNVCLRRIGLGNVELGDAGLEALAPGIAASTSLQAIDLEHKGIGCKGVAALAQALEDSPSLVEIQLNRNPIGQKGISCLAKPCLGRVQVLELREVDIGEGSGTCFEDLFLHGNSLRKVDLGKNTIVGSGVDFLARGLYRAKCLEELDLTEVGFGASHSAVSVAQALASLPCLQKVVCDGCKIGPLVGPAFASVLHCRSSLPLELDLSNNDVKEETVRAVVASLDSMDVVRSTSIALGGNSLDAKSIITLASVTYAGLRSLNLFNTSSISDCMEEFCTVIAGGGLQGVRSLDIGGCRMEFEQLELLFRTLMGGAMPSLLTLVVAANPGIEHDRFEDALEALRSKRTDIEVLWSTSDPSSALQKMPRCP
mmetsp:Transcript_10232/g.62463  ORF Transcript_10232/g.62463 Transcript_10232/m.62463 type:complete len:445 (+) Transcript_10232:1541-2875(+)